MNVPENLRYTDQHEWLKSEDGEVRVGITDYAQDALGDVVFVDLPDTGIEIAIGEAIAEVESTKSVAEVYAPLAGKIVDVNTPLADNPEVINSDPYGEGWFVLIAPSNIGDLDGMLDAEGYRSLTE
ncbi:MAG: glycine cleavage system protein GcvH [Acidimicrobiia bacterium]